MGGKRRLDLKASLLQTKDYTSIFNIMYAMLALLITVILTTVIGASCFGMLSGSFYCFLGMLMVLGIYTSCFSFVIVF